MQAVLSLFSCGRDNTISFCYGYNDLEWHEWLASEGGGEGRETFFDSDFSYKSTQHARIDSF